LSKYEDYSYTKEVISNQSLPKEFIYGYTSLLSPIYNDTDIKIIKYNEEFYDSTIQLIRSAKSFIHIQMFMIRSGVFFKTFCSELIKKAKEGIEIRLLFD
jgi:cardiolipin synthase